MKKYIYFVFSVLLLFFTAEGHSESVTVEKVVIETYRLPVDSSVSPKKFSIISKEDIRDLMPATINDILAYEGNIDLQTRGPLGIQSDINIRGGSFEQVLVVVDGIPVRDPQTGHFLMDIPVRPQDIERIEILKGSGTSLYGANAMTGIIHIITKKPEKNSYNFDVQAGENGFYDGAMRISQVRNNWAWTFSAGQKESDGYRHDTDFLVRTLNSSLSFNEGKKNFKLFYGYQDKDFGAANFYSNLFPHEEEHTESHLGYLRGDYPINEEIPLKGRLYVRKQKDHFILDRHDPAFFQSFHTNHNYGLEAFIQQDRDEMKWSLGGIWGEGDIESSSLGDHTREHTAVAGEGQWLAFEKTWFQITGRWDDFEDFDGEWSASAGISHFFHDNWKWRLSADRAFRVPSFTELYYNSPANRGNPDLQSEKSTGYEAGLEYADKGFSSSVSLFNRRGRNMIDWVRATDQDVWQAQNIQDIDFIGFELETKKTFSTEGRTCGLTQCSLAWSYTEADDNDTGLLSKYIFEYPSNFFQGKAGFFFPHDIRQVIYAVYKERQTQGSYWLFSTVFSGSLSLVSDGATWFISLENIFDEEYTEISDIHMPGRWVRGGISISF